MEKAITSIRKLRSAMTVKEVEIDGNARGHLWLPPLPSILSFCILRYLKDHYLENSRMNPPPVIHSISKHNFTTTTTMFIVVF